MRGMHSWPGFGGRAERIVMLSLWVVLAAAWWQPVAWAQGLGEAFRFTMQGEGVVRAVPDMAVVTLSVQTREKSAAQALARNTTAMRKVFAVLQERFGIAERDMASSGLSIAPVYHAPRDEQGRPQGPPQVVAHEVVNRLTVRVRALEKLGALIDAVVQEGANRLDGIAFGFTDRRKLLDEARRKAVADARAKARLYAEALGLVLGPVVDVREAGVRPVPVRRAPLAARMVAADAAAPTPVARGEQEVRVQASITWQAQQLPPGAVQPKAQPEQEGR